MPSPLTPLEELLLQLPRSIKGVGGAWLSVSDGPEGQLWTAGFENLRGRKLWGRQYFGDTPREALLQLLEHHQNYKVAYDMLLQPTGGKE